MSKSSIPEVIVGLGVGIGFIALFATILAPPPLNEGSVTVRISDFGLETHYQFSHVKAKMSDFSSSTNVSIWRADANLIASGPLEVPLPKLVVASSGTP
jgi:hypothetical protein